MRGRRGRGPCPPGAQVLSDGDIPHSFLHLLSLPPAFLSSALIPAPVILGDAPGSIFAQCCSNRVLFSILDLRGALLYVLRG